MRTPVIWLIVAGIAVFTLGREAIAQVNPPPVNLALGKPAVASSIESPTYPTQDANDGDLNTRWSSQHEDNQWLYIDLEAAHEISQVMLHWEFAYGESYDIDVSVDGINWETVFEERSGDGNTDVITFGTPVSARFVRMNGLVRGTIWGFSLFEFEIFDEVEDRYVDGNGTDSGNDCLDPANPCATITHAISQANPGNAIQIVAGDYTESFTIDRPLTLQGSGAGSTNIQAHAQPGMATSRVLTVTAGLSVDIADVTIRHGHVTGGGASGRGGGINNTSSGLRLTNVILHENEATYGGGMYNNDSSPVLTNVTFSSNTANNQGQGGGMYNFNSSPILTNVTFSENAANNNGGGISNSGSSSPSLINVTFTENEANGGGGGIRNASNSDPTLNGVEFNGNAARFGGGIYNVDSSPVLSNTTFSHNVATDLGGGMYNEDSIPQLANVAFTENISGNGGGMYNTNSDPLLTNVKFIGNGAIGGGGMFNSSTSFPALINVTFIGNEVTQFGGGILNSGDSSLTLINVSINGNTAAFGGGLFNTDSASVVLLDNSIVWGNTAASEGNEIWNDFDSGVGLAYSLYKDDPGDIVEGGEFIVAGNSLTEDPLFVDAPDGVLYLHANSPAINAGDPDTNLDIFPTDSQGNPVDLDGGLRVHDGRIDMGAFEFGNSPYQLYLSMLTK
jgi:hypothetical protein